ncbi:hypothetical protein Sjap_006500 [Stephania japonica]|uniref:Uncharacterized protein n=1 Tax=Stephania japonica TaxID=461633 RepID=A0AAP0K8D2_9MAGN
MLCHQWSKELEAILWCARIGHEMNHERKKSEERIWIFKGARNRSTKIHPLACCGGCWFVRRRGRGWWQFVRWRGKGVAAVLVLEEDPDQLQDSDVGVSSYTRMACSKKPVTREETGSTTGLCGGCHGRRPQTILYRKSKESACVTDASDVDEVHDETSVVKASATVGREIELHKSQVTTAETSSSDSIEEKQDESQEQEADEEDEGENEDK